MTVVAVAGGKGAPGATTVAFALAVAAGDAVLVETDGDGGVLAARLGLSQRLGLVSLAAAGRHRIDADLLSEHTVVLDGGVGVVAGPSAPGEARAALGVLGAGLADALADGARPAVIDAGRLHGGSAGLGLVGRADRLVWVCRPTVESADSVAARLAELPALLEASSVVVAGPGPYPAQEVADALGLVLAGVLPHDPPGAAQLWASARLPARGLGPAARAAAAAVGLAADPAGSAGNRAGPVRAGWLRGSAGRAAL